MRTTFAGQLKETIPTGPQFPWGGKSAKKREEQERTGWRGRKPARRPIRWPWESRLPISSCQIANLIDQLTPTLFWFGLAKLGLGHCSEAQKGRGAGDQGRGRGLDPMVMLINTTSLSTWRQAPHKG